MCKSTYPDRYGFPVVANPNAHGLPGLTPALPRGYLERLLLGNAGFGDDAQLEGISVEGERPVVLTSQPAIVGDPPTPEEIAAFMRKPWFIPVFGLGLGRSDALGFYRDLDELGAFDAQPGNFDFVKDRDGVILPIDLILVLLVRADADMQAALTATALGGA